MPKQQHTTWEIEEAPKFPKLAGDSETDILIIGGGMAGILTAYFLAPQGREVTLIEKATLGSDATVQTTAFLTQDIDTDFSDLVDMMGQGQAKLVWESHSKAINEIENIVEKESIDCEFMRCPLSIYAEDESEFEKLTDEYNAIKKAGFKASLNHTGLAFSHAGYLELPDQAKFHPLKFLYGVAGAAQKNGARIFEHTEAMELTNDKKISVKTKNGTITANTVIIATYFPFNNPKPTHWKKGMYNSYVYELEVPHQQFTEGLYLDMKNPYNYFRVDRLQNHNRVILGGADHREEIKMDKNKNFDALLEFFTKLKPGLEYTVVRKWVGPILEPSDGLALIGQYEKNEYVASAFSGNGMTYSVIAGELFRDIIQGKKNPFQTLYDPKRTMEIKRLWKKGIDYSEEFVKGAVKNSLRK